MGAEFHSTAQQFQNISNVQIDFEIDDFSKWNEIVLNLAVSWFLGITSRGYYLST